VVVEIDSVPPSPVLTQVCAHLRRDAHLPEIWMNGIVKTGGAQLNTVADLDPKGDRMVAPDDLFVGDGNRNVGRPYMVALVLPSPMVQGRARNV